MSDPTPLRAIFVEDNPDDARLMARELGLAGFETRWQRVEVEDDFVAVLDDSTEVVLCDNALPEFDAFRALSILQERDGETLETVGVLGHHAAQAVGGGTAWQHRIASRLRPGASPIGLAAGSSSATSSAAPI